MIVAQTSIDILGMDAGASILLIGILALLLWATIAFRNPAGIALWTFTVILVTISGLFGLGIEIVWLGILFTSIVTIIGIGARVKT